MPESRKRRLRGGGGASGVLWSLGVLKSRGIAQDFQQQWHASAQDDGLAVHFFFFFVGGGGEVLERSDKPAALRPKP